MNYKSVWWDEMASFEFQHVRTIATDFLEYICFERCTNKRENMKATEHTLLEWVNEWLIKPDRMSHSFVALWLRIW